MKYIVGLGNKGPKYKTTRHNVGFVFADQLAQNLNISFSTNKKIDAEVAKDGRQLMLVKPQTFMNQSGQAVRGLLDFYDEGPTPSNLKNLAVVHDDLDIQFGQYKIQFGVGPKQHNGLLSIYDHLGSDQFWHVRVGIENRGELRNRIPGVDYVLQPMSDVEANELSKLMPQIWQELLSQLND